MRELTVDIANEALVLLPERALLWKRAGTLVIADAAWRASSTRPDAAVHEGTARLDALLQRTDARRIVFLGDLLDAEAEETGSLTHLRAWRARHRAVDMLLVRGNRARHAAHPPPALEIRSTDGPLIEPPFVLTSYPAPSAAGYVLAGQTHPVAQSQRPRSEERYPCFWFGERVGVLPAFGETASPTLIRTVGDDAVYIITGLGVHAL
jgi:metallophosphoesterase superfamily enzyme